MHQVQLAVAQMFDGVTEVMHVEPAAPLTRVLQLMVSLKSRNFPVIGADHQFLGMISREDVIRALKEAT
ncbi:MAG: CBS domain-containing protein [Halobacteriota archaeon]